MTGLTKTETRTTVPTPPERPAAEWRRVVRGSGEREFFPVLAAAAAAVGFTVLLFNQLAPLSGILGMIVVGYLSFVAFYTVLVAYENPGPAVRARVVSVIVHSLAFVLVSALVLVVAYVLFRGWDALHHLNFITQDMSSAGPLDPVTVGGILHAAVGTLEQIAICLAITVPAGVICAVFLSEFPGPFSRFVRTIVEAMTALPSIVAGLFIYLSVILIFGRWAQENLPERWQWLAIGKSGFAASLALSIMTLPIIVRAADVVLRLVPGHLREASLALGASHWQTVWRVVLPTARSGLTTAVILGTARGIGETSPVLLTAGFATNFNANPFSGWQVSLPLFTFDAVKSPEPLMVARGFGSGAALMLLVLFLFALARFVGGRGAGNLSKRQLRRRMVASYRDARRFADRERSRATTVVPDSPPVPRSDSEDGHV
ncbi:phosphate ABC transporter, permease protein PstA [Micromonospora craterilacus]|uniref:Phosphate transport system permease protein PstA n=1 Tax=Micromonospora craterilacus TaxID=1655439 RepID=A0A2W2DWP0_9ACTN|nr:phosphate ABC transporter permease PstA [Micromonospora craterilacus]PZG08649.1 phosphate ABC transporter, permease protein PstA [Micromonospora craterilacus]